MTRRRVLSLLKTVRKYFGEAVVVTQEVDDIISSPVVKEAIINNSDCKILLDQRKYMNKFDHIQRLLGLTDKERGQILSINQANHPGRFYREAGSVLAVPTRPCMPRKSAMRNMPYIPRKSRKSWNCRSWPRNWAEIWNWP